MIILKQYIQYIYNTQCDPFIRLIKNLLVLDLFDFRDVHVGDSLPDEVMVSLLKLRNCTLVNELQLRVSSSRDLLMIMAAICAETSLFTRYNDLVLLRAEQELERLSRLEPKS
jgi:hypothetical protein